MNYAKQCSRSQNDKNNIWHVNDNVRNSMTK